MYVCPICKESLKRVFNNYSLKCQNLRCNQFKNQFKILKGIPNLIPFGEEGCILKKDESKDLNYGSSLRRVNKFAKDIRIISSRIFKGKNIISEEELKDEFGGSESYKLKASYTALDLVEELSENTGLSYPTTFAIIRDIEHDHFAKNPPQFIHRASALIKNIELEEMLRGLDYHLTNETFPFDFDDFVKQLDDKRYTLTPKRGVFDKTLVDSEVEHKFALTADNDDEVVCFLKLPSYYKIKTPIGEYEPDFGIVMKRKNLKDGVESEFYFVIETKGTNNINDKNDSGLDENTRTITNQIGIPAVTYSLNIANTANSRNEILAKPSLVAQSGLTSEFFSGTEILAAAVSGGDGDSVSVQKEVGVKLAVTPEILGDEFLRLHVVAERTFLTDPASSVLFEFRLDTTKTNVNSTVTMRFGETLILGGLSERETSHARDGVPGIMDIPGINLLFSERSERNFERSILILLTPRRPQYTRQAEDNRKKTRDRLSELERDIERLSKRHEDWFTPRPTFNGIIDALKQREFFEEFRSGDFRIKAWNDDPASMTHIANIQKRLANN